MSSFTSLGVKKGSTRFTPKAKARPRKSATATQSQDQSPKDQSPKDQSPTSNVSSQAESSTDTTPKEPIARRSSVGHAIVPTIQSSSSSSLPPTISSSAGSSSSSLPPTIASSSSSSSSNNDHNTSRAATSIAVSIPEAAPSPTPFDETPVATPSGTAQTPTPFDMTPQTVVDTPSPFYPGTPGPFRRSSISSNTSDTHHESRRISFSIKPEQRSPSPSSPPQQQQELLSQQPSIQQPPSILSSSSSAKFSGRRNVARRGKKFKGAPSTRKRPDEFTFVNETERHIPAPSSPSPREEEEEYQLELTPEPSPGPSVRRRTTTAKRSKSTAIDEPGRNKGKGIAIGVPGVSSSKRRLNGQRHAMDSEDEDEEEDELGSEYEGSEYGEELRKELRRQKKKKRELKDPTKWKTLEDINNDPAPPSFLDRSMSDFVDDLENGIVSKIYKEMEIERLANKKLAQQADTLSPEERARLETQKREQEERRQREAEERQREQERRREENSSVLQESSHAPQVRLINGQIVLDTDSLVVDRANEHTVVDTSAMEVVEETNMTRKLNSQTWGKKSHSARWTPYETMDFYNAIAQFGTDFTMVAHLLPGRTRNQVRNKFNREEKKHPERIKEVLYRKRLPMDMETVKRSIGRDFEIVPDDFHDPSSMLDE